MTVFVGTSGWQYRDWRTTFYPDELRQREWLEHYAARFRTLEINNSFYRLPPRERFEAWASRTPDDFVLCPKVSRFLSHMKKLADPDEPVARFLEAVDGAGDKLGPVLLQLPGTFRTNPGRLARALELLSRKVRVAVELRHESWFSDEVRDVLVEHGAALCWADRLNRALQPPWRTANWGYVRFHEGAASPRPCYGRSALDTWAARLAEAFGDDEVFVFFNNDPRGCAVRDAHAFALACARHGLSPTRTPEGAKVQVAG